jgi:hypothetical protein
MVLKYIFLKIIIIKKKGKTPISYQNKEIKFSVKYMIFRIWTYEPIYHKQDCFVIFSDKWLFLVIISVTVLIFVNLGQVMDIWECIKCI